MKMNNIKRNGKCEKDQILQIREREYLWVSENETKNNESRRVKKELSKE